MSNSVRKHLKLKPSKLAKKRQKALVFKVVFYVVFFTSLLAGVSFLSAADFMTVDEVKIVGLEVLEEKQIKEIVTKKTAGRVLWLFDRSNFLLYPKEEIKTELLKKYKVIAEAKVSVKKFSSLEISLKERHPFGLWCDEVLGSCFYLDQTGFIYEKASASATSSTMITYYGEVRGKKVGEYYLESDYFGKLYKFLGLLASVLKTDIEEVKKYESTVEIFLDTGGVIKVSLEDDLDKIFENLVTLINDPEFESEGKTIRDFSSIDLRFGQKIFYKLK